MGSRIMDRIDGKRTVFSSVAGILRMPSTASAQRRGRLQTAVTVRGTCLLHGFTLVELLVVISIIGVLTSLLLPAVQAAREAARRVQCSNNLHQLGLAVGQYEHTYKSLPPGGVVNQRTSWTMWDGQFDVQSGKMFSWIALVLPFLEQEPLFDQFDFDVSVLEQTNEPQATQIDTLLCSSDDSVGRFYLSNQHTKGKRFAKGNYAAWVSPFHVDWQTIVGGAISADGRSLRQIEDGVTHTIMLTEVRTREHPQDQRGAWALPWPGATVLAFDMHVPDVKINGMYQPKPPPLDPLAASLGLTQRPNESSATFTGVSLRGGNVDVLFGCPDPNVAQFEGMPCGDYASYHWLSAAPRSRHPGGVNVAFVDGRCGFLADEVDENVLAYSISFNDGQPPKYDDYVR